MHTILNLWRPESRRLTCGSGAALDTIQGKVEDVKIAQACGHLLAIGCLEGSVQGEQDRLLSETAVGTEATFEQTQVVFFR
jgi:hypothetical protein